MDSHSFISTCVGAVLAVSAAIGSNLGVNVQKKSHMTDEKLPPEQRIPYYKRPFWWLGMFLVVGGSVGDLLALGFAPQTLVASLGGGSTIFANIFFAHWWLKQPLYKTDVHGVILVTFGVLLCAAASQPEGSFTASQLWNLWLQPVFIVYLIILAGFLTTLFGKIKRISVWQAANGTHSSKAEKGIPVVSSAVSPEEVFEDVDLQATDEAHTIGDIKSKSTRSQQDKEKRKLSPLSSTTGKALSTGKDEIMNLKSSLEGASSSKEASFMTLEERRLPLYYAALSGTLGAQSVLLAKCVMELIVTTMHGDNQFIYLGTYIFLAGCVCCLLSQTHALNLATMHGDTMSTFPIFQAFWIGVSNINAIVYFQQAQNFSALQWVLFPSALTVAIYGIYMISLHEEQSNGGEEVLFSMPGYGFSKLTEATSGVLPDMEDDEESVGFAEREAEKIKQLAKKQSASNVTENQNIVNKKSRTASVELTPQPLYEEAKREKSPKKASLSPSRDNLSPTSKAEQQNTNGFIASRNTLSSGSIMEGVDGDSDGEEEVDVFPVKKNSEKKSNLV